MKGVAQGRTITVLQVRLEADYKVMLVEGSLDNPALPSALRQILREWARRLETDPHLARLKDRLKKVDSSGALWMQWKTFCEHCDTASIELNLNRKAWPTYIQARDNNAAAFGKPSHLLSESPRFQLKIDEPCACVITFTLMRGDKQGAGQPRNAKEIGFFLCRRQRERSPSQVDSLTKGSSTLLHRDEVRLTIADEMCCRPDARVDATLFVPKLTEGEYDVLTFVQGKPMTVEDHLACEMRLMADVSGATLVESDIVKMDCSAKQALPPAQTFKKFMESGDKASGGTGAILQAFDDLARATAGAQGSVIVNADVLPPWHQEADAKGRKLLDKLQKESQQRLRAFTAASTSSCQRQPLRVLMLGAGPVGLRCAVELAMLGHSVLVVEGRTEFTRLNVLHLWQWTKNDLTNLWLTQLERMPHTCEQTARFPAVCPN